jgi:RNase H-like domain found in reverse transcriptase
MTTAPVLAMPDFSQPFVLEANASENGIGAVLMQNRKSIAYLNKGLRVRTMRLSTYEKEFLALLDVVKKWRHYLCGDKFVIRTD